MAKISALDAVNKVLKNIGESASLTTLTALSPIQLLAFDKLNEAIREICNDQNGRWQFLECVGKITLKTGSYSYSQVGTDVSTGTDAVQYDLESFKSADTGSPIDFVTKQEFDALYPAGITSSITGYPSKFTRHAGNLVFNAQATASQNGKFIDFAYWKRPTLFSTGTTTGTVDIPEDWETSVMINMATEKVLAYLQNEEMQYYHAEVYGDGREKEGSFAKMKENLSSPELKPRFTYVL